MKCDACEKEAEHRLIANGGQVLDVCPEHHELVLSGAPLIDKFSWKWTLEAVWQSPRCVHTSKLEGGK